MQCVTMECSNCKYYIEDCCRRYPPTIVVVRDSNFETDRLNILFPTVEKTWLCGEWDR